MIMTGSILVLPGIKKGGYTQGMAIEKVVIGITIGKTRDLLYFIHN